MKYILLLGILLLASCQNTPYDVRDTGKEVKAFPDYEDVTIPYNVAPLDISVEEDDTKSISVEICNHENVTLLTKLWNGRDTHWDIKEWHKILEDCKGQTIQIVVTICKNNGEWERYNPINIHVSADAIDQYVTYRRIAPAYETFSAVGIYQRDITTFDEYTVTDCNELQYSCMNCHATRNGDSEDMILHVRGPHGGKNKKKGGKQKNYNTKTDYNINAFAYAYWHPEGRYIAFSTNTTRQLFHAGEHDRIDVFDGASDVQVFDTETDSVLSAPHIHTKHFENFPAFSPCGKWLYYVHADSLPVPQKQDSLRYVLCKVSFDANEGRIGEDIDIIADKRAEGLSLSIPRPSPDGRYIMISSLKYGNFPVWHPASDLWMYDIQRDTLYALEKANSPYAEAYHNWSSNSKWAVVASRRTDGLHTRLCIFHIDEKGEAGKAFLLPQRTPRETEDNDLRSYNCPEFEVNRMILDKGDLMKFYDKPLDRESVH
ncbi:MAG: hypothetical protein MJZ18_09295 [Bacteroidales bacterium]|nr:hypothetical protein [Bacteroidales bacterium]